MMFLYSANCDQCFKLIFPGWADVPWHESKVIAPTLLDLAKSGVILEQHYVQPICTPTRGALMTGKYAARLGLQHAVIGAVSDPIKFELHF